MTQEPPKCKCGNPTAIRHFKDGRQNSMGACRECLQKRAKNIFTKKTNIDRKPKKERKKKRKQRKKSNLIVDNDFIIRIDFSNYQEILNKIKDKAKAEIRTIESQILFYLKTI